MRQARRLGMGTELQKLREYGIGDDIRLMIGSHSKAFASVGTGVGTGTGSKP
jgi:hypothetical protein